MIVELAKEKSVAENLMSYLVKRSTVRKSIAALAAAPRSANALTLSGRLHRQGLADLKDAGYNADRDQGYH